MRELGLVSAMIVPLTARGRALGALTFVSSESGRHYDEDDLELAEDLARRAALSIDNAMLFRREHEAAVTLQRALLPQSLPELEGVEFAARYEPAAPGIEVGGDWYEVVGCDDGTVGADDRRRRRPRHPRRGGDGADPPRAARLRPRRLRAGGGGGAGRPPDQGVRRPEMTTVFHLQFDPAQRARRVRARRPSAGAPAPARAGRSTSSPATGTPPLGVFDDIECRSHRAEVPPGSLLLLYTDGLIERRGEDLDGRPGAPARRSPRAPAGAEECLQWLATEVSADEIPDDVAMLAMARAPR